MSSGCKHRGYAQPYTAAYGCLDTFATALACFAGIWFEHSFLIALLSATLLPVGSEPAVFGLVQLNPSLFWPAISVATVGNTLGGAITWWMGLGAHQAFDKARGKRTHVQALAWLERFGPRLFIQLAADGRRSGVRPGWLVKATVLALPGLYGDR